MGFIPFGAINLFNLFESYTVSISIAVVILASVVLGFYPRITGVLHWWVTWSFINASIIIEGGDQLAALITLMLIPITLFDSRKNHFKGELKLGRVSSGIATVTFTVIALQVALVYLEAGLGKIYVSKEWAEGTAMWYWLNNDHIVRFDCLNLVINYVFQSDYLTGIITYSVILFELTLFGSFFSSNKLFRKCIFIAAIKFHVFIAIFLGIPMFLLNMLGAIILLLEDKNQSYQFKFNLPFNFNVVNKYLPGKIYSINS